MSDKKIRNLENQKTLIMTKRRKLDHRLNELIKQIDALNLSREDVKSEYDEGFEALEPQVTSTSTVKSMSAF